MNQLMLMGLARLMPCFLIKLLLCLYEKPGCPVCRDLGCSKEDLSKRVRRPSHIQLFRERLSEKVHVIIPKGTLFRDTETVSLRANSPFAGDREK